MHKADEVAPGKAVVDQGNGPLADGSPDPTQQGLEADAVFIDGPQLDLRLGKGGRDGAYE
jgi:hypothetical protein